MVGKVHIQYLKNKKDLLISSSVIFFTFTVLIMLNGNFGIYDPLFIRYSAFLIILGILLINFTYIVDYKKIINEFTQKHNKKIIIGISLILFSLFVLFFTNNSLIWLSCIPLLLSGLDILSTSINKKRWEYGILTLTSLIFIILMVLVNYFTVLWFFFQQFSLVFTNIIGNFLSVLGFIVKEFSFGFINLPGNIVGKPIMLGPSVSGLWILLLFAIFLIVTYIFSDRNFKKMIFVRIGLILSWIFYLYIWMFFPFEKPIDVVNFQYVFLIIGFIPIFIYLHYVKFADFHIELPSFKDFKKKKKLKKYQYLAFVFLVVALLLLTVSINSSTQNGNIVINRKHLESAWTKPEYGTYGRYASGMFGLFPDFLEEFGYNVEILDDNITVNTFENADVLVIINLDYCFSDEEHSLIWSFVESGGSLLVMGDHTDIYYMRNPLNNLLAPFGISYRFDSAMALSYTNQPFWYSCMQFFPHPVTEGIYKEDWVGISVGASLELSIQSYPIITGRYAFSDIGNYKNSPSYLGDYTYNVDEQLGDIILVAGANYGKGKVLVFGDTSSFQNSALSQSYKLLNNAFMWLTDKKTTSVDNIFTSASLVLFGLFFLFFGLSFYKSKNEKKFFSILIPIGLLFSLIFSGFTNTLMTDSIKIDGSTFFIDVSHGEKISMQNFESDSSSGLILNLLRNNYSTYFIDTFSKDLISNGEGLILIGPTIPFTDDETNIITDFIYNGGLVILCCSYPDKDASDTLLKKFDLDILNIPLGAFPYEEIWSEPRFVDSWPILFEEDENTLSFYNFTNENDSFTYHLIVFKKYGEGGLLLISDTFYLSDSNLESLLIKLYGDETYWQGNVNFLKNIINYLEKMGVLD